MPIGNIKHMWHAIFMMVQHRGRHVCSACIFVSASMYMYIQISTHLFTYTYMWIHTYIHTYMYICMLVYFYVYIDLHVHDINILCTHVRLDG
jgi:hypothetical protein